MGGQHDWPRAEHLDVAWALAGVRKCLGVELADDGPCSGGHVGAAYVRWPDGHRSVLTWQPGGRLERLRAQQFATLEVMRGLSYPAPGIELAVELERAVVVVQELLPGSPTAWVSNAILDNCLRLNDVQAHALAAHPEVPSVRLYLSEEGPGFCLHEPLRHHSSRTAALERWVQDVGAELGADVLSGHDAVHVDFQPSNLLSIGDTITGVIDWDGAGRGDRRLDLVTLRFGLWQYGGDDAAAARLDDELDGMPPDVLRPAWAHMSLRMVDWAIRHFPAGEAERWLRFAEQRVS